MCVIGTESYAAETHLPSMVEAAVNLARSTSLDYSCHPAQGRLLSLLAHGRPGGLIGETGTGCGVGLAWMLSSADPSTRLVSSLSNHNKCCVQEDRSSSMTGLPGTYGRRVNRVSSRTHDFTGSNTPICTPLRYGSYLR
jgi:hypothetical protein